MTDTTAEQLRADYLARLDEAMRHLPHGVASDIRGGIIEELEGLDADATAAKIAQLGHPESIAEEAQREVPAGTAYAAAPPVAPAVRRLPATATRGFAITAALTLSFGGFVLPVLGWIVGIALVTSATLWRRWEKAVAIAVPFAFTGLSLLISWIVSGVTGAGPGGASSGAFEAPGNNPLVPGLGEWHLLILLGFLLIPASGLWLLWRLRGRAAR
ncbi:hypothetical protein [Microbacterium sp. W4I20]|uniref:hypothetical protein n=1 Tax=Microbacterium sp. W4I20 TaxID=3042262 RepID=UPI0027883934|nr:hypothetical protein [Microbacterium sp. W4I20]MDQ0728466.1 hypothetical protein [Microbacterium sp. W4I20]